LTEIARLKGLFFSHFAYVGVLSPFLSLYFSTQGYSVAQIGVLMTVPNILRIVSPPFWGVLTDRTGRGDRILRVSTVLTVLALLLLPFASAIGFWACLVLLGAMFFVSGAQVPISEARTLIAIDGQAGQYGRIRLWGSIGFVVAVVLGGPVLDYFGTLSLPYWAALALLIQLAIVWGARELPAGEKASQVAVKMRKRLLEPHIAAFLVANFFMIFSHAALYVLFSLFLESYGYSKTMIGVFWAIGVIAEIILFRTQQPLFDRFSATSLLSFSIAVAAVRFVAVGFSEGVLVLIVVTQLMHAATFGLHHSAVMRLLHDWFAREQQARAQAMYMTVAYGIGGTLGGLVLSRVWTSMSPTAAFVGAGVAALLGWLATLVCIRHEPAKSAR